MSTAENEYAPSFERDRFLTALDRDDHELSTRLAVNLTGCGNPLPSSTCRELGLPVGSSYGSAARHVIRGDHRLARAERSPVRAPGGESEAGDDRVADEAPATEAGDAQ